MLVEGHVNKYLQAFDCGVGAQTTLPKIVICRRGGLVRWGEIVK